MTENAQLWKQKLIELYRKQKLSLESFAHILWIFSTRTVRKYINLKREQIGIFFNRVGVWGVESWVCMRTVDNILSHICSFPSKSWASIFCYLVVHSKSIANISSVDDTLRGVWHLLQREEIVFKIFAPSTSPILLKNGRWIEHNEIFPFSWFKTLHYTTVWRAAHTGRKAIAVNLHPIAAECLHAGIGSWRIWFCLGASQGWYLRRGFIQLNLVHIIGRRCGKVAVILHDAKLDLDIQQKFPSNLHP